MSKTASGQVGPKNEKNRPPGKRVKRGRLHFAEEEVTRQAGEPTSGQVGPKPAGGGKFRQDEEREKPSSRLRKDGEAREDTVCEEQAARKDQNSKACHHDLRSRHMRTDPVCCPFPCFSSYFHFCFLITDSSADARSRMQAHLPQPMHSVNRCLLSSESKP